MSSEIVDIFADVVSRISDGLTITIPEMMYSQELPESFAEVANPAVSYVFGNARYFKDDLDDKAKSGVTSVAKFPVVCLFSPIKEKRNQEDPVTHQYYTTAKVNLLIACSSTKEWSNEQRKVYSFENILRPIYRRLMEELGRDRRLDWGYGGKIPHEYSENYSYGRYGAYTDASGNAVSEPIDAINIVNLQVKVKIQNCKRK